METVNIKQQAHELIDSLPANASWNDFVYEIYVRQEILSGIEDSIAGRVEPVESVRKEFGL